MKKIPAFQVVCMFLLIGAWGGFALGGAWALLHGRDWADPFVSFLVFLALWFVGGVGLHALARACFPLPAGEVISGSREELIFHVFHLPIHFFLTTPMAESGLVPIPLTRLFYRLLGARIGSNSYPSRSILYDPSFVVIGENVTLGHHACLTPHVMEGGRLAFYPIRIGDRATIGINAVLLAGVTVDEGATVAAGAVVPKFTHIGPQEIWGGLPAKKIGDKNNKKDSVGSAPTLEFLRSAVSRYWELNLYQTLVQQKGNETGVAEELGPEPQKTPVADGAAGR